MTTSQEKPVLHGRDHSPGGADPIPGLSGGIDFDTYPQAGQWLYIETDGPDTSPSGYGIELFDQGANGIDLSSGPTHLKLNDFGSGDVVLSTTGGDLTISASGEIEVGAGGSVLVHGVGDVVVQAQTVAFGPTPVVKLLDLSTNISVQLTDSKLILTDEDTSQEYLRVDLSDSSYHILTGATWVADL